MAGLPSFIIKSFTGLSDYEDKGVRGSFKNGAGINIRKRSDTLSCNQALTDVDDPSSRVIDQIIYFQVNSQDGNTYLFGTSKIWKQTTAGVLTLVYTDPDAQICGAAEWKHSNGKYYLFWATATKLKSKEIPGNGAWSDVNADIIVGATTYTYPKVNLTSTDWHTMIVASGALMICNDDKIAMVGYDGSYTNEALQLLPGNVSKTVIDRDDFLVVGAGSDTDALSAHIYAWQPGSLSYIKKKKIPAKVINALIDSEIMIMQADTNGDLYFSDFVTYLPITSFPQGGKVNPGGVVIYDKIVYFGVWGCSDETKNGVYSYGRNKKNGIFGLNFDYPITCTEIGSLGLVNGVLQVGYRNSGEYRLYKVDSDNKQVATYESLDLIAPPKITPEQTVWPSIKFLMKALPEGCVINVYVKMNKSNDWIQALVDGDEGDFSVTGATQFEVSVGHEGEIAEFKVVLTPNGNETPEIIRIEAPLE